MMLKKAMANRSVGLNSNTKILMLEAIPATVSGYYHSSKGDKAGPAIMEENPTGLYNTGDQ